MDKYIKYLIEQDEEEKDNKEDEEEKNIESKRDLSSEEEKDLIDELRVLIINNTIQAGRDESNNRYRSIEFIHEFNSDTYHYDSAIKRLLQKKLVDYKGNLSYAGKDFLEEFEIDETQVEDLKKFIEMAGDDWMVKLATVSEEE